jgi:hypothetical protein
MYDKKLDKFALYLLKYLYKTYDYYGDRLSTDVLVFCNNKMYNVDEDNYTKKIKGIPLCIKDNVKVKDYLKYYEQDSLNFIMEGRLCEYLYYYDVEGCKKVANKIYKIFKKYGYHLDFGSSISVKACKNRKEGLFKNEK